MIDEVSLSIGIGKWGSQGGGRTDNQRDLINKMVEIEARF